jgi:hypothetical protein
VSQQEFLKRVVKVLTHHNIQYMLTGSMASSLQGQPRSTHDVDLVVDLDATQAAALARAFPPAEFYLSDINIAEALRYRRMFNITEIATGEKADFWLLTEEPFDRLRFQRRRWDEVDDLPIQVSTPEDTILGKLRWSELCGGSEKQFEDALHVFEVQASGLDLAYMNTWADQLKVRALWERLQREASPARPH